MQGLHDMPSRHLIDLVVNYAPFIISVVSIFIEFSPVKVKPLTIIIKWIANIINKDVHVKLDEIEKGMVANREGVKELQGNIESLKSDMDSRFMAAEKEAAQKEASRLRAKIIAFADSCRIGSKHTQSNFENVFRDITDYYDYCSDYGLENHYIGC